MVIKTLRVDTLYTPYQVLHDVSVTIRNGVVEEVSESSGVFDIDLRGLIVAPGYVDTHIHGCCGIDVTSLTTVDELSKLSNGLTKFGVTSFVPTLVSSPHSNIIRILKLLSSARRSIGGSKALGIGLEGPYINPEKRGAQNIQAIRAPSLEEFNQYLGLLDEPPLVIHLAPEIKGAYELIQRASLRGAIVSIGHTDADYETATHAIALGATRATHLFNAMRGIHHREPGAAMALMDNANVYLELITDFIHLRPETILFVLKYAGWQRVVLVTDAIASAGLGDGEYVLGDLHVIVSNGRASLPDGTLAGSSLTIDKAVRNMISLGLSPNIAISMATAIPARSIGLTNVGCLRPGCIADAVVLDDKYRVINTLIFSSP